MALKASDTFSQNTANCFTAIASVILQLSLTQVVPPSMSLPYHLCCLPRVGGGDRRVGRDLEDFLTQPPAQARDPVPFWTNGYPVSYFVLKHGEIVTSYHRALILAVGCESQETVD